MRWNGCGRNGSTSSSSASDGIPILGFTWYSFFDQTDWDVELRQEHHRINPMGLYDLERNIRPVGEAYRQIIRDWQPAL